jgi:hypothetical protein
MTRSVKWLTIIVSVLVFIPLVAYVALSFMFTSKNVPSNIIDFAPSPFTAKADTNFFYSIGDELKFSDHIEHQSPTLARGRIKNFLVSPNGKEIAIVVDGKLMVVGPDLDLGQVTTVDTIYREPKPIGQPFFRDDNFQWSEDSKTLYLIRDNYYASKGSQLFSDKGELWKYDAGTRSLQLVLRPFRAFNYFFDPKTGIYYSEPTEDSRLQLKYFDGKVIKDVGEPDARNIRIGGKGRDGDESPFYSFSIIDYAERALASKRVGLAYEKNGPERLLINDRPYISLTQGNGFKGHYYCSELVRSVFLPGDHYFLFNASYCGNYNGQLLIDIASGKYQKLPRDTVVYVTLSTNTYNKYRVTGAGIEAN